ncbi:MAG: hypothetical protein JJ992_18560, partial [Planctomycetes bacterium]|nr:hypothetical protein [Planctomycetota bacterium]
YQAQLVNLTASPVPIVDQTVFSASFRNLVELGDSIKFDFKGPEYSIIAIDLTALPLVTITIEGETFQPAPPTGDVKYQVFRMPQKSSATPLEFSAGAVVDLSNSGVGLSGMEFASATTPIVIMFSPSGSVDRILGQGMPVIPPATIHLLVGSVGDMMELGDWSPNNTESTIPAVQRLAVDYSRNLDNPANLWVSISHQTGSVVTVGNAWLANTDLATSLAAAREFAQRGQAEGGR